MRLSGRNSTLEPKRTAGITRFLGMTMTLWIRMVNPSDLPPTIKIIDHVPLLSLSRLLPSTVVSRKSSKPTWAPPVRYLRPLFIVLCSQSVHVLDLSPLSVYWLDLCLHRVSVLFFELSGFVLLALHHWFPILYSPLLDILPFRAHAGRWGWPTLHPYIFTYHPSSSLWIH